MSKAKAEDDSHNRIERLKRRAEELGASHLQTDCLDDCPSEMEEAFWTQVVNYEEAASTTHFRQLESAGVSLPAPESLKDEELTAKITRDERHLGLAKRTNHPACKRRFFARV